MKKYTDKMMNLKISDKCVVTLFFVGIFSFLYFTGTLTSGYHFIDDHSMISMKTSLDNSGSFLKTSLEYTKNDFNIRFRPLFYPYYVSEVQVFGINFFALSIFTGMLAFFSFSFFYFGMRKLGHSFLLSALFVLLTFLGSQSAIWWRLGTNETIAMFFLGLCFLFMARCLDEKKYATNNILFVIFLSIASLCKESFIIVIPAFVAYKILIEMDFFKITLKESIGKNVLSIFPLVFMVIELGIIKFVVGTNKIGYAGVTSSTSEFITGIKNILFNKDSLFDWIALVGMLVFLYLFSFIFMKEKNRKNSLESIKPISAYLCFSLMVVLPNIFMYAKSGMVERYLLPTTLGIAFLIVGILKNTTQIYFKVLMFLFVIIFMFGSFDVAKKNAMLFANSGNETNALLSTIRDKSRYDSKILLVADPVDRYEVSWSTKTYLSYFGFNNFYVYPVTREYKTEFELGLQKQWELWFKDKKIKDMYGAPDTIVFIDKKQINSFFEQNSSLQGGYKNSLNEDTAYAVYFKK